MQLAYSSLSTQPTATITGLTHEGRGIAQVAGKITFIAGALPGETVTFRYRKRRRQWDEAEVVAILNASPQRVSPGCAHFGVCGGCQLQHIASAQQIQHKQQQLAEQFQHFGRLQPLEWLPPLTGSVWGYRRKARLGVRYVAKKKSVLVGFREQQSNYLAMLDNCAVLHPSVGQLITPLRQLIASLASYQSIAQIEVAVGDEATALIFRHLQPLDTADQTKLLQFAQEHHLHLYLQPGKPDTVQKIWPADGHERLCYHLPQQNLTFWFHPLDFTQINAEINQQMVTQAVTLLDPQPHERVLDLYCGLGNFSLPLAQRSHQVIGIEGEATMVERARENASLNQLTNTAFYCANLEKPDSTYTWLQSRYDKVLLDPPRSGALAMIPYLAQLGAKCIVYVSCNPATLARDAGELVHRHGYQLAQAGVMDMFPHTRHIESMAVLVK